MPAVSGQTAPVAGVDTAASDRVSEPRPQGPLGRGRGVHSDRMGCPLRRSAVSTRTGSGRLLLAAVRGRCGR
jgi:hypothetical protein